MAHGPDTRILFERIADCIEDGVTTLNLAYLNITSLPQLPHIHVLNCHHTNLTVLPYLPEGLVVLNCHHTYLTSLPALPSTLMTLKCANTLITSLPELPPYLMILWCNDTLLTTLPELPVSIAYLYCYNSPLILQRGDEEDFRAYNLRWRAWREEHVSKPRIQERTLLLKEDLMMEAWHPDRVERWLDAGLELERI
jgi:hypothetical protein